MLSKTQDPVETTISQGLMFRCLNWAEPGCQPGIVEFFDSRPASRAKEETRRLPGPHELPALNDICRHCSKAYLEIDKKECPACGSTKIVEGFAPNFNHRSARRPQLLHSYYCVGCGKYLFSGNKL